MVVNALVTAKQGVRFSRVVVFRSQVSKHFGFEIEEKRGTPRFVSLDPPFALPLVLVHLVLVINDQ